MCGIAGVVAARRPSAGRRVCAGGGARRARSRTAVLTAPARGIGAGRRPDVLLVHRRLAIIDPGPGGAQPMATPDGRYHIVFNGEVYNYRALRADLESRGERFVTGSDTEVLLRLVAREGPPSLARVRGMFAFAMLGRGATVAAAWRAIDSASSRCMSRRAPRRIAFASELGALRAVGPRRRRHLRGRRPGVSRMGQRAAAADLAARRRDARARHVAALAASTARATDDARRLRRRARPPMPSGARARAGTARTRSARTSARPFATACARISWPTCRSACFCRAASTRARWCRAPRRSAPRTCRPSPSASTMRRRRSSGRASVATLFGTTHHELHVDARRCRPRSAGGARAPRSADHRRREFVLRRSRACRATGIKAVLSGAGGDELFGGYPSFTRLPRAMAVKRLAGSALAGARPAGRRLCMPERLRARWRHFASTNGSFVEAYRVQRGFLAARGSARASPARRCATPSLARGRRRRCSEAEHALLAPIRRRPARRPQAAVARLESRMYLGSQLLRDLDVMSMAHGLEVRVPFVDHELVEQRLARACASSRSDARQAAARRARSSVRCRTPSSVIRSRDSRCRSRAGCRAISRRVVQDGLRRLADGGWITRERPSACWADWHRGVAHWSRPWGLSVLGHFLSRTVTDEQRAVSTMSATTKLIRRAAGAAYRQLFPTPEVAAWRHADAAGGHDATVTRPDRFACSTTSCDTPICSASARSGTTSSCSGALEFQRRVAVAAHSRLRRATSGSPACSSSAAFRPRASRRTKPIPALFAIAKRQSVGATARADVEMVHAALWTSAGRVTFRAEGSDSGMIDGARRARSTARRSTCRASGCATSSTDASGRSIC